MKKIILRVIVVVMLVFLAGTTAIVIHKLKKEEQITDGMSKQAAVYLLSRLGSDDATSQAVMSIYEPLKNDTGISAGELSQALSLLGITWEYPDILDLDDMKQNIVLTPQQFYPVFQRLITDKSDSGISKKSYYIFGQDAEKLHTNDGQLAYAFYDEMEIPQEVGDFYVQNDTVIYYIGHSDGSTMLHNVWLTGYEDGSAQLYMEDQSYSFPCNVSDEDKKKVDTLADIFVSNQGITDIFLKSEVISGKVLSVTKDGLKIEKYGELPRSQYYKIYKIHGKVAQEHTSNILVGYEKASFVVANGMVEACLITEEIKATNIRVVINDTGYKSVMHNIVKVTCNSDFTMKYGKKKKKYKAGDQVTLNMDSPWFSADNPDKLVRFTPKDEDGRMQLLSVERAYGSPEYRGTIEVALLGEQLAIVNELPIEEYLYSVIPSEMPTSYPMEALKAQAICARGYAYKAVLAGTYASYGAHLDDSTNSQVYNNSRENEASVFAVKDTYGEVALYDGLPMNTYFFSTSAGVFCNDEDVWGGKASAYLTDHLDTEKNDAVDLSSEDAFVQFMNGKSDEKILEKDQPFYRWTITFRTKQISAAINKNLADRIEKTPTQILVKNKSGRYVRSKIDTIGTVKSIEVTERGKSGIIKTMIIIGSKAEIKVTGQTNIRTLISPEGIEIVKQDGKTVDTFDSMPSPYYYVEKQKDAFVIHGGGFGHGVGMSQNGAKVLADMGYTAEKIVKHYYAGAKLENIYEKNTTDGGKATSSK